jgi:hypothetical protein
MSSHFNRVEEEDSSLEDEVSSVRSMKVAEIKLELSQRGLATDDMFEKEEFVRRLAQAAWTRFRGARAQQVENPMRVAHAHSITVAPCCAHTSLSFTRCGNAWPDGDSSRESARPNPEADARLGRERRRSLLDPSRDRSNACVRDQVRACE